MTDVADSQSERRNETFRARSELRLDCAGYCLACPFTAVIFSRRTGQVRVETYVSLKPSAFKRMGQLLDTGNVRRCTAAQLGTKHISESKQVP